MTVPSVFDPKRVIIVPNLSALYELRAGDDDYPIAYVESEQKFYYWDGEDWSETPSGGGGENPNSRTLLSGTLATLKADMAVAFTERGMSYSQFVSAFLNGDVSASIYIDAQGLGFGAFTNPVFASPRLSSNLFVQGVSGDNDSIADWSSYDLGINFEGGTYLYGQVATNVMDMSSYLSSVPYQMVIYWHEMPEGE